MYYKNKKSENIWSVIESTIFFNVAGRKRKQHIDIVCVASNYKERISMFLKGGSLQ